MFGMFFVAEFLHAFTVGALTTTLFLGGWLGPGVDRYPILGVVYFFGKSLLVLFSVIWVRMSLPRIRIDQMLAFNWKFLTPLGLAAVIVFAVADKLTPPDVLGRTLILLAGNGLLAVGTLAALWGYARIKRRAAALPVRSTPPLRVSPS